MALNDRDIPGLMKWVVSVLKHPFATVHEFKGCHSPTRAREAFEKFVNVTGEFSDKQARFLHEELRHMARVCRNHNYDFPMPPDKLLWEIIRLSPTKDVAKSLLLVPSRSRLPFLYRWIFNACGQDVADRWERSVKNMSERTFNSKALAAIKLLRDGENPRSAHDAKAYNDKVAKGLFKGSARKELEERRRRKAA